jgi:hypothetical protein
VAVSSLSEDFTVALKSEYKSLAAGIATQRERADRLRLLAEQAEEQAARDERALREIEELLGLAPQMRLEHLDRRLRGQRLREVAVEVLAERHPTGEPIHYREWYELLRQAGYAVGGRDPLATFLAQVNRSSRVRRIGRRTGLYVLQGGQLPDRAPAHPAAIAGISPRSGRRCSSR